ncbi:solute carrier family 22 member 13 [Oncorhynchus tshawytscha]|uniref:Major facilitator superfamily (MFS) profile domain-containing protein n=1 Tax=Oncorhynchus tshawytscha TaxID=74940 RepID=A0AAZ3QRA1_ONCTS|nr:solute carrier family 22 member 13 [Oncorhynchus tshawytscha]
MAPLQLAVYLRLALIFFFTAFLFFLDVFTVSRAASSCAHVPSQLPTKSQTGGDEVSSSSVRKQNRTPGEVREMNVSLISVLLPTQDEITWGNDTDRDNGKVCLDPMVLSYSQTMYMAGLLLGSLFGGSLSDRYGKRVVLLVCVCVHAVTAVLPAVLPHAILFLTLRCLAGVSCCCINICSFSLGVEWSLPRYRIWPPALLSFSFSLGMMALAPLAYLTHTWTQLHLALAIPQILCLPLYYSIPESPHWLLLKKRLDTLEEYRRHSPEDKRCLDLLLETEGKDLQQVPRDTDTLETGTHIPKADTQTQEGNTLSHCGHMRSPTILLRLVIMSYIGLASALTYYGICLNVGRFGVDVFLAQFFSGLSEAPCLLVPFLLARCGRRPISMLSLLLSGSFCLLSLLASRFYAVPGLVMALALVGKLCMQTSVFVSVLYGIELFPTLIRQKCVGLVCLCYRVGCILNAVVSPRGETIPLAAMILYGSGPIVGAGLCLLLPETSGVPLPDSLEDCDRQPRLHLPLAWSSCSTRRSVDTPADKACPFLGDPEKPSHHPQEPNSNENTLHTHTHAVDTFCI